MGISFFGNLVAFYNHVIEQFCFKKSSDWPQGLREGPVDAPFKADGVSKSLMSTTSGIDHIPYQYLKHHLSGMDLVIAQPVKVLNIYATEYFNSTVLGENMKTVDIFIYKDILHIVCLTEE